MSSDKQSAASPLGAPAHAYMDTAAFWSAARSHRLVLQYCLDTGRYQNFPRPGSVFSGSRRLEWREATGQGRLASWTVDRISAPHAGGVPRLHALVDLAEGVRLLTWLVNCDVSILRIGLRVEVSWVSLDDGRSWPAFQPEIVSRQGTGKTDEAS